MNQLHQYSQMTRSLVEIASNLGAGSNRSAKPVNFYAVYDPYFGELADRAIAFLELGVHAGISLKVWASFFPNGRIIGVDLAEAAPDFSGYPNIVYESADQTDRPRLAFPVEFEALPVRLADPPVYPWVQEWRAVSNSAGVTTHPVDGKLVAV